MNMVSIVLIVYYTGIYIYIYIIYIVYLCVIYKDMIHKYVVYKFMINMYDKYIFLCLSLKHNPKCMN